MAIHGRKSVNEVLCVTLACGATVEGAAQKAGISERTAYRRLQDPKFRRRLQTCRSEMVQRAAAMLTATSLEAVKTLLWLLQQASVSAAVRLGAARAVLEMGAKLRELVDLEERVLRLEEHGGPQLGHRSPE